MKDIFFQLSRLLLVITYAWRNNVKIGKRSRLYGNRIKINRTAVVTIGTSATLIGCKISLASNARLSIGPNVYLKHVTIEGGPEATINLGDGVIMNYMHHETNSIVVGSGTLDVGFRSNLICSISIWFNGRVSIGRYTNIGYDTEIVCDESVRIGDHCLISNSIDIFDTNSHDVDFLARRSQIEACYPSGCHEVRKPATKPIVIGNDIWIGKRSIILKGSTIGDRSIVGMGTKVKSGVYPENSRIINGETISYTEKKPGSGS